MKNVIPYIPLIVISGLIGYSIYIVSTSNIIFSYEHYIGLSLVLIGLVSLPYSHLINKLATFLALLLGTFSQAAFTPTITRYRLGFSIEGRGLDIAVQPYCLLLMLLFMILNWHYFKTISKVNAR